MNKTSDPYYQSNLTLRSNAISNQQIILTLERMGEYADEQNYTALSKELKLSIDQASQVRSLESFWFYDIDKDGIFEAWYPIGVMNLISGADG